MCLIVVIAFKNSNGRCSQGKKWKAIYEDVMGCGKCKEYIATHHADLRIDDIFLLKPSGTSPQHDVRVVP